MVDAALNGPGPYRRGPELFVPTASGRVEADGFAAPREVRVPTPDRARDAQRDAGGGLRLHEARQTLAKGA